MARQKTSKMRAKGSNKTDRMRGSQDDYREGLKKINWHNEAKEIIDEQEWLKDAMEGRR